MTLRHPLLIRQAGSTLPSCIILLVQEGIHIDGGNGLQLSKTLGVVYGLYLQPPSQQRIEHRMLVLNKVIEYFIAMLILEFEFALQLLVTRRLAEL